VKATFDAARIQTLFRPPLVSHEPSSGPWLIACRPEKSSCAGRVDCPYWFKCRLRTKQIVGLNRSTAPTVCDRSANIRRGRERTYRNRRRARSPFVYENRHDDPRARILERECLPPGRSQRCANHFQQNAGWDNADGSRSGTGGYCKAREIDPMKRAELAASRADCVYLSRFSIRRW
jgi:hypothetical protein